MNIKTKMVLVITTGGVFAVGLFVYKYFIRRKYNEDQTDIKDKTGKDVKTQPLPNKPEKKNFEVAKCISIELNNDAGFTISKAVDLVLNKREMNLIVQADEDSRSLKTLKMKNLTQTNLVTVLKKENHYEEDQFIDNINMRNNVQPSTMKNRKRKSSNASNDISCTNNNTMLNFLNELKNLGDKEGFDFTSNQPQTSICLPSTVKQISDEVELGFDDAGYISSAEEDLQDLPEFIGGNSGDGMEAKLRDEKGNTLTNKIFIITEEEELEKILHRYNPNMKYQIEFEKRIIEQENVECEIIPENLLLLILNFLYEELNTGLIELSDNFTEERLRYFKVDMQVYISIIDLFLRKKEEYFLAVLSALMHRLGISQVNLDNTLVYYMNHADQSIDQVKLIKKAYDKVYQAGIKETMAPKAITKGKIKEILSFQCEQYKKMSEEYPNLQLDVIEIMVVDLTYEEFGYDKEAIKAAFKKHSIDKDESFFTLISQLREYQQNSFLNI